MLMQAIAHGGCTDTRKRVCTESLLWEKNPLLHEGIEPASDACRSDALSTELHPHQSTLTSSQPPKSYQDKHRDRLKSVRYASGKRDIRRGVVCLFFYREFLGKFGQLKKKKKLVVCSVAIVTRPEDFTFRDDLCTCAFFYAIFP